MARSSPAVPAYPDPGPCHPTAAVAHPVHLTAPLRPGHRSRRCHRRSRTTARRSAQAIGPADAIGGHVTTAPLRRKTIGPADAIGGHDQRHRSAQAIGPADAIGGHE